jgi:hypothetical protein
MFRATAVVAAYPHISFSKTTSRHTTNFWMQGQEITNMMIFVSPHVGEPLSSVRRRGPGGWWRQLLVVLHIHGFCMIRLLLLQ